MRSTFLAAEPRWFLAKLVYDQVYFCEGGFIFCARILSEKRKRLYTYCIFSLNDEPSQTFTLPLYTVSVQICHKPINYNW